MRPPTQEYANGAHTGVAHVFKILFGAKDAWIENGTYIVKFAITARCIEYRTVSVTIPIDTTPEQTFSLLAEARRSVRIIELADQLLERFCAR